MGIINLLDKIVNNNPNFSFVDEGTKAKVTLAYNKGIDCILNMQIKDNGRLTAWCQQHDEETLLPAWARKFEPPSICNAESVGVVLFLMKIKNPNDRIIQAIQSAVKWFADSRIYNTRTESFEIQGFESKYKTVKRDVRVVTDLTAPPIWTRYYELGSHKPLFSDRNSELLYSLAEVSVERRSGYSWYTYEPQKALDKYADWQKKYAPSNNVLQP
jgi:PelA/Pel-15E family pectate lyase